MKVGLFVPCFVDQLFPDVALATLEVLERQGLDVSFPPAQTCCGQPLLTMGATEEARASARHAVGVFAGFDYIVAPSASCVSTVRTHYPALLPAEPDCERVAANTFELCEFLVDVIGLRSVGASFRHRVGIHIGCHGLRELHLAQTSEVRSSPNGPQPAPSRAQPTPAPPSADRGPTARETTRPDKVRALLQTLDGIEIVDTDRSDECCGFGGTFAYQEEAVSVAMGQDRIKAHEEAGVEVIASTDASCQMHLGGLLQRSGHETRILHIAQILAGRDIPR